MPSVMLSCWSSVIFYFMLFYFLFANEGPSLCACTRTGRTVSRVPVYCLFSQHCVCQCCRVIIQRPTTSSAAINASHTTRTFVNWLLPSLYPTPLYSVHKARQGSRQCLQFALNATLREEEDVCHESIQINLSVPRRAS